MAGGGNQQRNVKPINTQPGMPVSAPPHVRGQRPGRMPGRNISQSDNPNVFGQAAGAYNQALDTAQGVTPYAAQTIGGTNLDQYMNPFTQNVIDTTMDDMNRARQMSINDIGAQATSAGAFGGSRQGIAEAETNRAFADQVGRMSAGLNAQNFTSAQNMAGQDANALNNASQFNATNQLNAAGQLSNLAGQGFGFGQAINGQQMQQGTLQQSMQQRLADAARGQYGGYTGAPAASMSYPLAALGVAPNISTTTQTQSPGLFDFLSLGLGLL